MAKMYKAVKDFNVRVENGTVFKDDFQQLITEMLADGAIVLVENIDLRTTDNDVMINGEYLSSIIEVGTLQKYRRICNDLGIAFIPRDGKPELKKKLEKYLADAKQNRKGVSK